MFGWLRFHIDHNNRVRWEHEHLPLVRCGVQRRRRFRAVRCMHVFCWVRLNLNNIKCVRDYKRNVLCDGLRRG